MFRRADKFPDNVAGNDRSDCLLNPGRKGNKKKNMQLRTAVFHVKATGTSNTAF